MMLQRLEVANEEKGKFRGGPTAATRGVSDPSCGDQCRTAGLTGLGFSVRGGQRGPGEGVTLPRLTSFYAGKLAIST